METRNVPMRGLLIAAAISLLCGAAAVPGFAQGYKGVMASDKPDKDTTDDQPVKNPNQPVINPNNTFGGAVAPPHPQTGPQGQKLGYRGVMPGYVAPEKAPESTPESKPETAPDEAAATTPPPKVAHRHASLPHQHQMTYADGRRPPKTPHFPTPAEIEQIEAITGEKFQVEALTPEQMQKVHISKKLYTVVAQPQPRIDGMLPAELMMKQQIDTLMSQVNDPALSDDARKAKIQEVMHRLGIIANHLDTKSHIPDSVAQAFGVPAVYVEEDKEATQKSVIRIRDAVKQLQDMQ